MPTRRGLLAALGAAGLGGCSLPTGGGGSGTPPERSTPPGGRRHWYTHPEATGNRSLAGGGNVRDADPVTFSPEGAPRWLVAHPAGEGSYWTVVTEDGRASRWRVRGEVAERVTDPEPRPTEGPPVVATGNGAPRLVDPPGEMAAGTAPMVAPGGDGEPAKLLYVAEDGALVVAGDRRTRFDVDALPDGRLAALGDGRYALFTAVTDRYEHGALGDSTEGTTLTVVDPAEPALDWQTTVGPPEVFEGLQPLVADLDGDGDRRRLLDAHLRLAGPGRRRRRRLRRRRHRRGARPDDRPGRPRRGPAERGWRERPLAPPARRSGREQRRRNFSQRHPRCRRRHGRDRLSLAGVISPARGGLRRPRRRRWRRPGRRRRRAGGRRSRRRPRR